ncbi:Platelet-activating factor acetylhydrolase IB subunit gamma [Lamellibrachia satsuma]|nr:Platelet-activating factor acetylhydrolase IB subunit gamma [Lamellibrachia satsuma]
MNQAATPVPVEDVQGDGRWMSMHNRFLARTKEREPEVLFVGDSIILQLSLTNVWQKFFVPLHSLNFGIGGDQTQHVLWRLQNGELDNFSPKVIVVQAGTNNHGHTVQQVVDGLLAIVSTIIEKQPQAMIMVLSILPRGQYHNPLREKFTEINDLLNEKIPTMPNAQFLYFDPHLFVNVHDGSINHHDMYDFLHLTEAGYQKYVEPLVEEIQTLLKNFMTADALSVGDTES